MLAVDTRTSIDVVLYRGEGPQNLAVIRSRGITGRAPALGYGLPSLHSMRLSGLPAEVLVHEAKMLIEHHVRAGSGGSPFVSFSEEPAIAVKFALAGGGRDSGIVVRWPIRIVAQHSWEGIDGWGTAYTDSRGRTLVPTAQFRLATADAITRPQVGREVRALGIADQELLVFGVIAPWELRTFSVKRRW